MDWLGFDLAQNLKRGMLFDVLFCLIAAQFLKTVTAVTATTEWSTLRSRGAAAIHCLVSPTRTDSLPPFKLSPHFKFRSAESKVTK